MNEYFPVVKILADATRSHEITKVTNVLNPYQKYEVAVLFQLEDGRKIPTTKRFKLQRDAKAFRDTLPTVPDYPTEVSLTKVGTIETHRTTFSL